MTEPVVSVIIPAFNEEARLASTFTEIRRHFASEGLPYEVILVDDGSWDMTVKLAQQSTEAFAPLGALRILRNETNRGKGYSVRRGMLAARGKRALMTDADLSTPLSELANLQRFLDEGDYDLVIASRDLPGARVVTHQPWMRERLGKAFNRLVRCITGLPFYDTQCGFKLFDLSTTRELFLAQRLEGWVFDVEILFIASRWGLRVAEVPVRWSHTPGSKVHIGVQAPRVLVDLLRIRLNNAVGSYRRERISR
jgi:glycosyltransferase involved in cell wall biosynthesis